eukprot:3040556-Rhodomonas_salina.1
MWLRACYAQSGTDMVYGATRIGDGAKRLCHVLSQCSACTDRAKSQQIWTQALTSTGVSRAAIYAIGLRACYAMPGTVRY